MQRGNYGPSFYHHPFSASNAQHPFGMKNNFISRTITLAVVQILLAFTFLMCIIFSKYVFKSFAVDWLNDISHISILQLTLFSIITLVSILMKLEHCNAYFEGHAKFYREIILVRKVPFIAVSLSNAVLVILWGMYYSNIWLLNVSLRVMACIETAIIIISSVVYLGIVLSYNKNNDKSVSLDSIQLQYNFYQPPTTQPNSSVNRGNCRNTPRALPILPTNGNTCSGVDHVYMHQIVQMNARILELEDQADIDLETITNLEETLILQRAVNSETDKLLEAFRASFDSM